MIPGGSPYASYNHAAQSRKCFFNCLEVVWGWLKLLINQAKQIFFSSVEHKKHKILAGARFSKAPETFQACKAILCSSVSKNWELYMP